MTPLRWIGLGVGIMGALALVAVLLVLSAPVQTWAVRRALDAQPHVTGEIARVKAGWGGVTLEGVELQTTAGALRARRVEVEWNGWAALRSRVAITRLVAQDWEFDPTRVLVATVPASVREETLPERRVATAGWWMAPSLPLAQAVPGALGAWAAGGRASQNASRSTGLGGGAATAARSAAVSALSVNNPNEGAQSMRI